MRSVLQDWVMELPLMQQSVLIAAMRGPDGVVKDHPSKSLCKWLRRCIVISAFDGIALTDPYHIGGGSYTGPSLTQVGEGFELWEAPMDLIAKKFLNAQDDLPHHFYLHFIHAAEIIGYKHSDMRIRNWWAKTYQRFCHDMHMKFESQSQLDSRLNDNEAAWRKDESRFKHS